MEKIYNKLNKRLKLPIKKIIFFLKTLFRLDQLKLRESKGEIRNLSQLKFLPKTILNVPFNLGRSTRGISFENLEKDLVGKQFINQLNGVPQSTLINNYFVILKKESELNAGDVINLPNNNILKNYPAWAVVMPWERIDITKKYSEYIKLFIKNRKKHGLIFDNKVSDLTKKEIYSHEIAISHVVQTQKLLKSLRENGIKKSSNYPRIFILKNNEKWRWIMATEGNHRAYLFYLLGLKNFSVIIEGIINKQKLRSCYNVKNGLYSLNEAEKIFDGIFDGSIYIRGMI